MTDVLRFRVYGSPVSQGSIRASVSKSTGRAIAVPSNEKGLKAWREAIVKAAKLAGAVAIPVRPLEAELLFFLPRPKSAPKSVTRPAKKPDIDKLERAVLDAGTGTIWEDDAQVVRLIGEKYFATAGQPVGLIARIREVTS